LFGESLRGLRVLSAVAQGVAMILAALMARDMGGKRNAQILTAFAVFIVPMSMFGGTVIMYFAFDYLWWVLVAFFTVRLLATDDARYWLGIGAGIGLGMMTKYTMAFCGRSGRCSARHACPQISGSSGCISARLWRFISSPISSGKST
jgi:4-amino-4-deoxy-L-arabinose transferase-like glycosyltransferase